MRYLSILLILISAPVFAQVDNFSANPEKFLDQVEKHLGAFDRKDAKEFVEEFGPVWMSMSTADQTKVVEGCNAVQAQKLRIYPEFKGYISSVHNIFKKGMGSGVFVSWHSVVMKVLGQRKKSRMSDILESSATFFEQGAFYTTTRLEWAAKGGEFEFGYDNSPFIEFKGATVVCHSNGDSSVIKNTSGTYRPYTYEFFGKGGKVEWTRVGLDAGTTYADFSSQYEINVKTSAYKIDSVTFHTTYFDKPLQGKLTEKVLKVSSNSDYRYPRFESYSQRLKIDNVMPDVNYDGGFTMSGATFVGAGTFKEPAHMIFLRKGQPFITTGALEYNITEEKISAPSASVKINMGKDSIYHPGVRFDYIKNKNGVYGINMIRPKEGVGQSPFSDTYHELDMYFESMSWTRGDSTLTMGPLFRSSKTDAVFESRNHFNRDTYGRLGMGQPVHPMVAIAGQAIRLDQFTFKTADLATALGATKTQITGLLYELNNNGFINYDKSNELIHINQKLFDYVDNAAGRKDYDNIIMYSDAGGKPNAVMNVSSFELEVKGLQRVNLSDRQFVKVYPRITDQVKDPNTGKEYGTGSVKIYKNRNIVFEGIFVAGSAEFFGDKFDFNYEEFTIDLAQCDSLRLRVYPFEGGKQVRLVSVIEDVKGEVMIDGPRNRASLDTNYRTFPVLKCTKESYVFYDKFYGGAYPRERFYFKLKPFVLDSLDNFKRDALEFEGELVSADIFPTFEEKLVVMPDYSLGFMRKAPADGFGLYKDKGLFQNEIRLTAQGLQGDGVIEFVTSTSVSKAFTFFPDSTMGVVDSFINVGQKEPKEFPDVKGYGVRISYKPNNNILSASSYKGNQLNFFRNEAVMDGKLSLTPERMTGRGKMMFSNADLLARQFKFRHRKIISDTSSFNLHSLEEEHQNDMAFKTNNVNASVDFDERMGLFKSNDENSFVEFPDNQYICYMDEFKWFMDDDDLEMQKKSALTIESTEFEQPNFYSIHPDQDSLSFMAPKARYDVKKRKITCTEVPFMDVADARIVPDSGLVIVRKKAKIETLKNAMIIANNVTKNHTIINATVDVTAKRAYTAEGDYFYVDADKNEYKIHFAEIKPDSSYTTFAEGEIREEENFKLSPQFDFVGKVELYATNKSLVFDGATRIAHTCETLARNWMNFRAQIDPNEIYIPVSEDMKDLEGNPIGAGIIMNSNRDSLGLYSTFLSRKGSNEHPNVITASGFLHYDQASKEYRISNKEKLQERTLPGNYVSLQTTNCIVEGDGKIGFGVGSGQVFTQLIGVISQNLQSKEVSMSGAMRINFPFNDDALKKIAENAQKKEGLLALEFGKTFYKKSLMEILPKEDAEKIESDLVLKGEIKGKIPDELQNSFYIADVKFKWNQEQESYISDGLIGIANINKEQVFKYVNGKIVLQKRGLNSKGVSIDKVYIYLEVDAKQWYYFEYTNDKTGRMFVTSGDDEFMTIITETKEDKLKYKGEKGVEDFEFQATSKGLRNKFFNNFYE